ncbi:MAG: transporter permease [Ferruginibacter sp.]|nr:transporter permease [Ferruginibacter sp.]
MFKNHLTVALRNFWRNKTFSVINVLGLSIGISAALVIFMIVYYEFSYDKFEPDGDRIYRVVLDAKFSGTEGHSAAVPAPLGAAIENEVTGVEHTVPVFKFQGDGTAKVSIAAAKADNLTIYKKQPNIVFANQHYFYMLPYKWVVGSPAASLKDPFSVVLTESRARQYFPSVPAADIIGKQITYNEDIHATVTGIVKDLNETTAFNAVEFVSLATISKTNLQNNFMMTVWNDWMAYSHLFIKLSKGVRVTNTEAQLEKLLNKYNKEAHKDANNTMNFHLQPLNDMHFNRNYQGFDQRLGHKPTLFGLLAIGAFLLLLGCINFINLTTAQAMQRAKEIGIRKTMGSSMGQLVIQFLSETFFITIIATILSVALTPLLLKMFDAFIPPGLHFDLMKQPALILFVCGLIAVVSFLSGLYPAFVLSAFNPLLVLKGQAVTNTSTTRNAWVRKTLTVSQFVIAQFFIIATVMVGKQINYSLNGDMGFNKEAVINFNLPRDTVAAHPKQLLEQIKSIPGVAIAATGFMAPADQGVAFTNLSYNNGVEELKPNTQIRWGDPKFIKIYEVKLIAGRNVLPSDSIKEFLVNESYAHAIGFLHAEEALNKFLDWNGKHVPIVGIMKDFHDQSFHAGISPMVFGGNNGSTFHIKLAPNNSGGTQWKTTIAAMQSAYKKMYPEEDFNYTFLDDTIAALYKTEQQTASLLQWATGLTIFISCLGLLGLVIYTTNTRTKEIGIRKILGASITNIVAILSKDFVLLVVIAFVIASPVAWWATYQWLQDFAYRTNISWWVFIVSGMAMLLIALLTLSIQTIRTAVANPVKSLRTE